MSSKSQKARLEFGSLGVGGEQKTEMSQKMSGTKIKLYQNNVNGIAWRKNESTLDATHL